MKKFEYKLERMPSSGQIEDIELELDEFGSDGWELCGINYGCWIFKREIIEERNDII